MKVEALIKLLSTFNPDWTVTIAGPTYEPVVSVVADADCNMVALCDEAANEIEAEINAGGGERVAS